MKNRMFKYVSFLVVAFLTIGFLAVNIPMQANAATATMGPLIVIDKYEISEEKIIPGEDFTLSITISNYSDETAQDVMLDIANPSGVAPVYGTVSQVYVGDIAAGESKEIDIDYNSFTSIVGDTLDFYVTIVTSLNQNYIVLRVPTGSDSPFSIVSVNIPDKAVAKEICTVSLAFQVLGEENVRDVALVVSSKEGIMATSHIGIVTPGITRTQQLSTTIDRAGEYTLEIGLEYVDSAGQKKLVPITTQTLVVSDAENAHYDDNIQGGDNNTTDDTSGKILLMGFSGFLILGIFLVIVIVARKNK